MAWILIDVKFLFGNISRNVSIYVYSEFDSPLNLNGYFHWEGNNWHGGAKLWSSLSLSFSFSLFIFIYFLILI